MRNFFCFLFFLFGNVGALIAQHEHHPFCNAAHVWYEDAATAWGKGIRTKNYNCRSDTLDIIHYQLDLDFSDERSRKIKGSCKITAIPLMDSLTQLTFDFEKLRIDSILFRGQPLAFEEQKDLAQLRLFFDRILEKGDTLELQFYYQGRPVKGSWHGFAYNKGHVYNIGSSFKANPHNFGRAWYPCFDSYAERATYSFRITTQPDKSAHCNGVLVRTESRNDRKIYYWELRQPIPTYLSAIAIAEYHTLHQVYNRKDLSTLPIELVSVAKDTARMAERFKRLDRAIAAFEHWFGPYAWDKVGFSIVPGLGGGMEHATNTTFSRELMNSELVAEEFMAHELGHSWFGNQITCKTSEDLWINEGFATYCEHLFWEYAYGRRYMDYMLRKNAYFVLPMHEEANYQYVPLVGAPHKQAFSGLHIYRKGAFIAHNLRAYLGDSLFAKGFKQVFQDYKYQPISSIELEQALSKATGTDLQPFFKEWVFEGGFPHIEIDFFEVVPAQEDSCYKAIVQLQQRLLGRTKRYTNLPITISLMGQNGATKDTLVQLSDSLNLFTFELGFEPQQVVLNKNSSLNQARIDYKVQILPTKKDTILTYKPRSLWIKGLHIATPKDTSWMHLAYHPITPIVPQANKDQQFLDFYWSIKGFIEEEAEASLELSYSKNARKIWGDMSEIELLYRARPQDNWEVCTHAYPRYDKSLFELLELKQGDYVFALKK